MRYFRITPDGEQVELVKTVIIEDEFTKKYAVIVADLCDEDKGYLSGDVHFEVNFEHERDADNFYELLKEAEIIDL